MNDVIIGELIELESAYENKFNNKNFPVEYYNCSFDTRKILLTEAISTNTELINLKYMQEIIDFIKQKRYEDNMNKCLEIYKNKRR